VQRPDLVADHLSAYAALFQEGAYRGSTPARRAGLV